MRLQLFQYVTSAIFVVAATVLLVACDSGEGTVTERYDLVLSGGVVIDGTGADRYAADIAIRDGRIAAIGGIDAQFADDVLDVTGLVIAPGFIDAHSHADEALRDPASARIEGFLRQGVTTAVYGVDGYVSLGDFKANMAASDDRIMGVNYMSYIGHNGVRSDVMGNDNRAPTADEFARMAADIKTAMDLGALGFSTGLMYLPGNYATTEEVIELTKVVAPYGGKYDSHIRDPANNWVASVTEALHIGREAGVHAHVAHLKAVGAKNIGKAQQVIDLINARILAGERITADVYPYDGASTRTVLAILHPADDVVGSAFFRRYNLALRSNDEAAFDREGLIHSLQNYWREIAQDPERYAQAKANTEAPPDNIFSWVRTVGYQSMRIVVSRNPDYEGRMVTELADALGISPFELYRRLVVEEGAHAMVTLGAIQEAEVRALMQQPWAMVASDGEEITVEHPRGRGTFPRLVGPYVRDWGVFTLEEAVYKITGMPAEYLELPDRGVIREGAVADLAVFHPETVIDRASWAEPTLYAEGVEHVLIGGAFALRDGALTEARLGRFIPFKSSRVEAD